MNDPTLLKAARQIYLTHRELRPDLVKQPTGVAINRLTYRGRVLFATKPILLPQEDFVPLSDIESQL